MIKNVIIVNDYDYVQGGASLVAIESANLLYDNGLNVVFFCGVSNSQRSILNKSIPVVSTNKYDSLNNPNKIKGILQGVNNKSSYKKMYELLKQYKNNETIIFIHGYTKVLSTSFIKACKKYNFKTMLTAHDYFSICPNGGLFNYKKNHICSLQGTSKCKWCNCDSRNYLFKLYRNYRFYKQKRNRFVCSIDYLITISENNENLLKPFFKNSKIVRIYNPTSIKKKFPRVKCENNLYFIYVGRIDKEKGIDLMCEAFLKYKCKLYIVGDGTELENLKKRYNQDNIIFTGWVNHDKIIEYMKKSKALVFPSLLYEGAPLTIFEAQSLGLPVIVSKYSNGKDFVSENDGWIYNPYDIDSLIAILGESYMIEKKSCNSYDKYWKNPYTKEKYINELLTLFKEI